MGNYMVGKLPNNLFLIVRCLPANYCKSLLNTLFCQLFLLPPPLFEMQNIQWKIPRCLHNFPLQLFQHWVINCQRDILHSDANVDVKSLTKLWLTWSNHRFLMKNCQFQGFWGHLKKRTYILWLFRLHSTILAKTIKNYEILIKVILCFNYNNGDSLRAENYLSTFLTSCPLMGTPSRGLATAEAPPAFPVLALLHSILNPY